MTFFSSAKGEEFVNAQLAQTKSLSLSLSLLENREERGGVVTATKQICRNSRGGKKRLGGSYKKVSMKAAHTLHPRRGGGDRLCSKQGGWSTMAFITYEYIRRASFTVHVERTFNVSADAGSILHDPLRSSFLLADF